VWTQLEWLSIEKSGKSYECGKELSGFVKRWENYRVVYTNFCLANGAPIHRFSYFYKQITGLEKGD
jgi:hypothetical protein